MKRDLLISCITAAIIVAVVFYILYLPKNTFSRGLIVGSEKIEDYQKPELRISLNKGYEF